MTPSEFRVALADLGLTQAGLARLLVQRGHPAAPATVARSVRRWATVGPSSDAVVILALLREQQPGPSRAAVELDKTA